MPAWGPLIAGARRIPWRTLFVAGQQLYQRSRGFRENLSAAERTELGEILRKSKGRRANLTDTEVARLTDLVRRGVKKQS